MSSLTKDKDFKTMIDFLENSIGQEATGTLIAVLCDSLKSLTNEEVQNRYIRTVEIKYNDFFTTKFDFEKGEYINEN